MATYFKLLLVSFLLVLIACKSSSNRDLIMGEWTNESMKVFIDHDTSKEQVFDVPKGKWEEILLIQPILTSYTSDGKYNSVYKDLDGKVINTSKGYWEVNGDSMSLTQDEITTRYHFNWMQGRAEFKGYLDWDGDGEADDLYTGVQMKH
uniref:hypothetical protein n=1 Tax=Roseivirga sp. TaxID=1964215 RepID=UPI0040472013